MIDQHEKLSTVMLCYSEQQFIRALRREPERRNIQVCLIFAILEGAFNNYVDRNLPFLTPHPVWTVFIPSAWTKTDMF